MAVRKCRLNFAVVNGRHGSVKLIRRNGVIGSPPALKVQTKATPSFMNRNTQTAENNPSGSYLKLAGALLLVVFAGVFLFHFVFGGGQKPDLSQFASVGGFAAEEAAKIIGKSGRVVLVYDINDPKTGGADAGKPFADQGMQSGAFRRRLGKLGAYIFAKDWMLARPNMVFRSVWPDDNFTKLLNANPPETTIVLFATPPPLTPDEKRLLQARSGKLVVIGGALPDVQWLAKERLAHLVIATRYPVPPPTKKPETEREVTARVYAAVTPETASQP